MATTVQIELMVDDKGAVTGIRNVDASLKGAAVSTAQLDAFIKQLNDALAKTGQAAPEVKKIGDHALTSLDNVRLLRDDLGIRLPRSMEKAIASSATLSTAIKGIGGGLLALGAVQIGFAVFTQAYDGLKRLWDEHLSLTKAAEDYYAEVKKTQAQEFGNTSSIEDTDLRIKDATDRVEKFQKAVDNANKQGSSWRNLVDLGIPGAGGALQAYHEQSEAHDAEGKRVEALQQRDKLVQQTEPKQYHEQQIRDIDLRHGDDYKLKGQEKLNAELRKTIELRTEERRFENQEKGIISGNPVDPNTGKKAFDDDVAIATNRTQAEKFELGQRQAQEMMRLRHEAEESGLRGSALYYAQESHAIEALKFQDINRTEATKYIREKFHNEEMKRLEDEQRETQKIIDETKLAGLTGIAHVQMRGQIRENDVVADRNLDPAERDKRVAAIREQTAAEVVAKQLEWTQRVDEVVASSQERQVSGFARIAAEADKARADLQRQFDEAHKDMNLAAPGAQQTYDQDTAKLGQGMSAIGNSSDYQSAQLAERNAQETLQIEQEAQRKSMSELKQQTAAINAEYAARLSKYQEQLRQQEISDDDYNRRVAAAAEERDAEMVAASKAAREKMAGEFDSFFKSLDHPVKALAGLGEKVAGEVAAGLVQKLQQRVGANTADAPPKGGFSGFIASVLDGSKFDGSKFDRQKGVASEPSSAASTSSQPGAGFWPWHRHPSQSTFAPAITAAHPPETRPSEMSRDFAISSATVRIGTATIALGGMGSGISGSAPVANGGSSSGSFAGLTTMGGRQQISPAASASGIAIQSGEASSASGPSPSAPAVSNRFRVFPSSALTSTQNEDQAAPARSGQGAASRPASITASSPLGVPGSSITSLASPSPAAVGGAGASRVAASGSYAGSGNTVNAPKPSVFGGAVTDLKDGKRLVDKAATAFGGGGSSQQGGVSVAQSGTSGWASSTDGMAKTAGAPSNGGMLGGGGIGANLGGAVSGGLGLFNAYKGDGGVGGGLKGAMSGMELGAAVAGPLGAAVGAIGGAVLGAIGFGGKEQARVYDLKTVRPKITGDTDSYQQGSMDYTSAYSDLQATDWQARVATGQFGPAGHAYYEDYIVKEMKTAEAKLTQMQKAGRSMYTAQAAQFDIGADSIPHDGMAMIHANERIFPSDQNERITKAVEAFPSMAASHASYQAAMQSRDARSFSNGPSRNLNMTVHALDARSVAKFFDQHKHTMRSALNDSYAENSGGGIA